MEWVSHQGEEEINQEVDKVIYTDGCEQRERHFLRLGEAKNDKKGHVVNKYGSFTTRVKKRKEKNPKVYICLDFFLSIHLSIYLFVIIINIFYHYHHFYVLSPIS